VPVATESSARPSLSQLRERLRELVRELRVGITLGLLSDWPWASRTETPVRSRVRGEKPNGDQQRGCGSPEWWTFGWQHCWGPNLST
jgi:hypothetical protein